MNRPNQNPQTFTFLGDAVQIAKHFAFVNRTTLFVSVHVHGWQIGTEPYRQFGAPIEVRADGEAAEPTACGPE